jgi:hypothetical protein
VPVDAVGSGHLPEYIRECAALDSAEVAEIAIFSGRKRTVRVDEDISVRADEHADAFPMKR